jgi:hypothetical protein
MSTQDIVIVVLMLAFGVYVWYGLRQTQQDIDQAARDNQKVTAQNDLEIKKDTETRAEEAKTVDTADSARDRLSHAWDASGVPDSDRDLN